MKVVVTGGAGFLGSHLVDRLVDMGYHVAVIDNFSSGRLENISHHLDRPGFQLVRADLREAGGWVDVFQDADVVFHLAANPEVRHSTREPLEHYHQNLTATMHVLEAARKKRVKIVVFASSSTVYGDPEKIPTPEDHPLKPISVYGATKAAGELLCQTYARLYSLACLILRYANIVGPRLRHGVIYDFILKLRKNPRKLEILGDGTQRKSYLHVADAIQATLKALEHTLHEERKVEVYNVGNRDWTTVREIADTVAETLGLKDVQYIYKPATPDGRGWPGDVKLMLLDITRITRDTGWKPTMTSLEAVRETARKLAEELKA